MYREYFDGIRRKTAGKVEAQDADFSWIYEMVGFLGLSLPDVLRMTIPEILLAVKGKQRSLGVDPDAGSDACTRAEYEEMKARHG